MDAGEINTNRRRHLWKIRRQGFRELLLKKKWLMRGGYAEKKIGGHYYMSTIVKQFSQFYLVLFERKDEFWRKILP
ncbi:MAG: hypothetical protein AB1403_10810 [Candidatus Riflebacteria bacterium]